MSIRNARLPVLTVLSALIATSAIHAATIKVPLQQPTLQAALAAATEGDKIVLSAGTYYESLNVSLKKNLTIKGKGEVILDGDGEDRVLNLGLCIGVKLSNLTFRNATDALVRMNFGAGNRIEDCVFLGTKMGDEDGLLIEGGGDHEIVQSRFLGISGHGAYIAANNIYLGDCEFVDCGRTNEYSTIRMIGDLLTAESNEIEDNGFGTGIFLGQNGTNSDQALLLGNKITGVGFDGIHMDDATNCLVMDNIIKSPMDDGIDLQSGANNNEIKGNRISQAKDEGIEIGSDNNTFAKNRIKKSDASGVHIFDTSTDCIWVKNRIRKSGEYGIAASGSGHMFKKNNVKGSAFFDLTDEAAPDANQYKKNKFGTTDS